MATVTGGAGFIGTNLVRRLLDGGQHDVTVVDDLSRAGAEDNLRGFAAHPRLRFVRADVADAAAMRSAIDGARLVYHLAGQVAVTTSLADPRRDFESNALGTLNVLEAARAVGDDPVVLYASTNKVYGALGGHGLVERPTRYDDPSRPHGVDEHEPLDFHSPYGCSKGAGDQYVRDYHRVFGLRTIVLRQSCIVGPRQFGVEDQGWAAWFVLAALTDRPITIFGDGKQVRDVLDVDDLLDAYDAAIVNVDRTAGEVFNVGGGPGNTISIWAEFGPLLESLIGREVPIDRRAARAGDQRWYVSDIGKLSTMTGWRPTVGVHAAVDRVHGWIGQRLTAGGGPSG